MKNRGIQRGVKPKRFDRSAGDAPSLGRVVRMAGVGLPKELRKRRRRGGGGRGHASKQRVVLTWSALLVLVSLIVMGVALWSWLRLEMDREETIEGALPLLPSQEKRLVQEYQAPSEREAVGLVKRALAIREVSEVAAVFHPGLASPERIVDFLTNLEAVDGAIAEVQWRGSSNANGLSIEAVLVKSSTGDRQRNRLALLTPDEVGDWKIDFDAFARTVEPSWDELLDGQATVGVVRVIVSADSYFNGPFRDDSQWDCYGMVSPDTDVVMMGYCRKASPQAKAMKRIVAAEVMLPGIRPYKRATLEIGRVEGAELRQFEITRVLAEDWVISATPFDAKFH